MKLTGIFLLLILAFAYKSAAQNNELKLGSRFTIGQSELTGDDFSGKQSGLLIGIGGTADYHFNKWFGIMGDAMLMRKGFQIKGSEAGGLFGNPDQYKYTDRYAFYQAEFPVMAKIRLGNDKFGFRVFAGPSLGFNLLTLQSREYDDLNYNDNNGFMGRSVKDINILDKSLHYGLGIEILNAGNQLFFADIRSCNNLSSIGYISNKAILMNHFCVSLGYLF